MSTARKKGVQPDFLVDEVWEKLKEIWSDEVQGPVRAE